MTVASPGARLGEVVENPVHVEPGTRSTLPGKQNMLPAGRPIAAVGLVLVVRPVDADTELDQVACPTISVQPAARVVAPTGLIRTAGVHSVPESVILIRRIRADP